MNNSKKSYPKNEKYVSMIAVKNKKQWWLSRKVETTHFTKSHNIKLDGIKKSFIKILEIPLLQKNIMRKFKKSLTMKLIKYFKKNLHQIIKISAILIYCEHPCRTSEKNDRSSYNTLPILE